MYVLIGLLLMRTRSRLCGACLREASHKPPHEAERVNSYQGDDPDEENTRGQAQLLPQAIQEVLVRR